jgi:hypothetical protein
MARSTKLADLMVKETSGVDHPAHLHEGWLVMKSEDMDSALLEVINADETKENPVDLEVTENAQPEVEKAVETDDVIRKELSDLRKQLDDIRKEKEALEAVRALEKATEIAKAWEVLPELDATEFAPVLCALRAALPNEAEVIEKVLTASARAFGEAGVLAEIGTTAKAENDAWATIQAQAQQLVIEGKASDFAKAVTLIATTNKDLYNQYLTQKGI